jgi:small-conductance mechanosensitive channel
MPNFLAMSITGFANSPTEVKITLSVAMIVAVIGLRAFLTSSVFRRISPPEERRRWMVRTRNVLALVTVLALAAIWADALRTLAVSMLAIAVAFVIATKDLIQSLLGGVMRSATNAYSVGDRIEVGSHRGDVIDQNLFRTTIMEVGPGTSFHLRTGRIISFPNSKLLETYVINESYSKQYVNHMFSVPIKMEQDWKKAEEILLEAAREECAHYLEFAQRSMKNLEDTHGLDGLPVQPRVSVQLSDPNRINLLVRVPALVGRQGRVEQAIVRRFLERFVEARLVAAKPSPSPVCSESSMNEAVSPVVSIA